MSSGSWKALTTHGFGLSFVALFVAMDIVGTLPLYVSMTHGMAPQRRNRIVDASILIAVFVAVLFMFLGQAIFLYLGITLYDFKMAGGLVLLLISLADLVSQPEVARRVTGQTGVVPLAVPLITGPAVLTTVILQANAQGYPTAILALLVNGAFAWLLLRRSGGITRIIGKDGTVIVSKIAALLLAAIAISMIRSGIFDAIRA